MQTDHSTRIRQRQTCSDNRKIPRIENFRNHVCSQQLQPWSQFTLQKWLFLLKVFSLVLKKLKRDFLTGGRLGKTPDLNEKQWSWPTAFWFPLAIIKDPSVWLRISPPLTNHLFSFCVQKKSESHVFIMSLLLCTSLKHITKIFPLSQEEDRMGEDELLARVPLLSR